MSMVPDFKIKGLSALDFKDAEIKDVSAGRSYGRRFRLKIGDVESKEYTLSDIYKRVGKLSHNEIGCTEVNVFKGFFERLKSADALAEVQYRKRSHWYKFRTWFHRVFDSGSHKDKIDKFIDKLTTNKSYLDDVADLLRQAVAAGDIEKVKELLEYVCDVDRPCEATGITALMMAAGTNQLEIVKLLLSNGADCNLVSKNKFTPLSVAVMARNKEIIQFLIEYDGIDVDGGAFMEGTPLIIEAVIRQDEDLLEILLRSEKVQVDQEDLEGETALSKASAFGHKKIVERLLQSEKIDLKRSNAFMSAKMNGKKEVSDLLRSVMQPDELLLQKEKLKLLILANATSIAGTSYIQDSSLDLEGGRSPYIIRKMRKATIDFARHYPELMEKKDLLELFDASFLDCDVKSLERIKNGLPTLIHTGFTCHAVSVFIWDSYFCICNKGDASRKVLEVFQFDPQKLNHDVMEKLRKLQVKDADDYRALFFEELPDILGFMPKRKFEKDLETLASDLMNLQTVGNCVWASPETAVFCYFMLSSTPHDVNNFFTWKSFVQAYQLEGYLGTDVLREFDSDKAGRHEQRREAFPLDCSVVISALKEIKTNASKTHNANKIQESLERMLDQAISRNSNAMHGQTAQEILASIESITPNEMKCKFNQSI